MRARTRLQLYMLWALALCSIFLYRTILPQQTSQQVSNAIPAYFTEVEHRFGSKLIGAVDHIDSRFVPTEPLNIEDVQIVIIDITQSYISTMQTLGIETWLAHGSLLGWYWGGKVLPWDTDADTQMTIDSLKRLAQYNMTRFEYGSRQQTYLLDINPWSSMTSTQDVSNKIDARWIHVQSGRYLDITAVHSSELDLHVLYCKDGHEYRDDDIFPLQSTLFEGIWTYVPSNAKTLLVEEYGQNGVASKRHHWHTYDDESQTWIPDMKRSWWG